MQTYDIGVGWANPFDRTFIEILRGVAREASLSLKEITFATLADDFTQLENGTFNCRLYLDRGSVDDPGFAHIARMLQEGGATVINNPSSIAKHSSKAALYSRLAQANLPLPRTFIVGDNTPQEECNRIAGELSTPFVIISAYGAGDTPDRLSLTATEGSDIIAFVEDNYADLFLVHEYVQPTLLLGKTAWFRPIYARKTILPLWWNPLTHFYQPFGNTPEEDNVRREIEQHMHTIASLTEFELFSSEFALSEDGGALLIDYANHPIDLDSSENTAGGLPPETLDTIARALLF